MLDAPSGAVSKVVEVKLLVALNVNASEKSKNVCESLPFIFVTGTVVVADEVALKIGRIRNKEACDIYAECKKSGRWPGYSDDVETVALPVWFEREFI